MYVYEAFQTKPMTKSWLPDEHYLKYEINVWLCVPPKNRRREINENIIHNFMFKLIYYFHILLYVCMYVFTYQI